MVALTVLSVWAMGPIVAVALLALTCVVVVFTVWQLVGFDILHDTPARQTRSTTREERLSRNVATLDRWAREGR